MELQFRTTQEVSMELQIARQIIDTLAQGIHPITGEAMPEDSPYNAPPVIRALHAVSRALEDAGVQGHAEAPAEAPRTRRSKPRSMPASRSSRSRRSWGARHSRWSSAWSSWARSPRPWAGDGTGAR